MTSYHVYIFSISLDSEGTTEPVPLQANYGAEIMADSAVFPHPDGSGGTEYVTALPLPHDPYVLAYGDTDDDIKSGIRGIVIAVAAAGFEGPGGTAAEYVPPISLSKNDITFIN